MAFVWLIPVILCHMALAAHFLYHGNLLFLAISALVPLLLFIRQEWTVRLVQTVLFVGGMEWIRTANELHGTRVAHGEPYTLALIILGSAAIVSFLSIYVFNSRTLRNLYGCKPLFPGRA